MVTSQEKLDEVVAAFGPKRVDIAKLQDRFRYRIDLAPADIREVASKRVLLKTDAGEKLLRAQFRLHEGQLNNQLRLDSKSRRTKSQNGTSPTSILIHRILSTYQST